MKKRKILLIILLFIIFIPIKVFAKNDIYTKDAKIYITKDGTAQVTETWDVKGEDGTEWYIPLTNLGESEISNFTVQMDNKPLKFKNWDIDESLSEKAGYYGYNYISNGVELCFGKTDFKRHTFVIKYDISNFVFTTNDADVINWRIFEYQNNKTEWTNFSVTISSYYSFPDTLDVWGYGYKGYAYVKDGVIQMSNEGAMGTNYVVLLAKFPKGTFNTNISYNEYQTFDDVYQKNEEGTFDYDYEEDNKSFFSKIIDFIISAISTLLFPIIFIIAVFSSIKPQYGYKNNKKIIMKEIPNFRDIPCNKDIYYANTLLYLNNMDYKEANIIGAIILKWVKEDKIEFIKKEKSFKKVESVLDLTKKPTFDNEFEQKLFDIMYKASIDGYLESKELEKWCRNNYSKFFDLFKEKINDKINLLTSEGQIRKRIDKNECKSKNVMSDKLYEDSVRLYGLKKFLLEFSQINTKETIEVKLWDEYLMFAYLFGIADKVAKQLKNLYPEYMAQTLENNNLDFDTIIFINSISSRSVSAASSARSAAQSYSSGGGGFSSGGGGGGSFGGGGSLGGGGSR